MMRKNRYIFAALALLVTLFTVSCGDEEKDPIYVRIFSYGSSFSGWYVLNGESPEFFLENAKQDGDIYYRELKLEDLDEVEVEVTSDAVVSAMAIRVYKDDEKVKEVSQDASLDEVIIRLNIFYTYGESSDDDTEE